MSKFGSSKVPGRFGSGKNEDNDEIHEEKGSTPEYTNEAFSVIKHPDNNGFALVRVSFNPVTKEAVVTSLEKHENRSDTEYYFKVAVGEYFAAQEKGS
jgi:hypothetical protein